jgi:HAD superfamily hydrolase (TIGR01450 family)
MRPVAWVLDLDGVIWLGDEPIAGAAAAVARLRAAGQPLAFVTNNSYGRRADVAAKLVRHGIEAAEGEVITSAVAVAGLVAPGEVVLVCGGPGIAEEVERRGARAVADGPADVVVVGYDPAFDYGRMTAATRAVRGGARLLATNDDATYPTPGGPVPGGGAILASIATASGATPVVAGKPHRPVVDLVRARLGPEGIAVGDRPDTDGRFAVALGYRFGLVLSGVTARADLPVAPEPQVVAADLATLVAAELAGEPAETEHEHAVADGPTRGGAKP